MLLRKFYKLNKNILSYAADGVHTDAALVLGVCVEQRTLDAPDRLRLDVGLGEFDGHGHALVLFFLRQTNNVEHWEKIILCGRGWHREKQIRVLP